MRNKTSDDQFRRHLHRTEKKARYHTELRSLFQMYVGVVGGLYQNMMVQQTVDAYDDIVQLQEYSLAHLRAIKARYGSSDMSYDERLGFR